MMMHAQPEKRERQMSAAVSLWPFAVRSIASALPCLRPFECLVILFADSGKAVKMRFSHLLKYLWQQRFVIILFFGTLLYSVIVYFHKVREARLFHFPALLIFCDVPKGYFKAKGKHWGAWQARTKIRTVRDDSRNTSTFNRSIRLFSRCVRFFFGFYHRIAVIKLFASIFMLYFYNWNVPQLESRLSCQLLCLITFCLLCHRARERYHSSGRSIERPVSLCFSTSDSYYCYEGKIQVLCLFHFCKFTICAFFFFFC